MMKIKVKKVTLVTLVSLVTLAIIAVPMSKAAHHKLFTLEDLNSGGTNYHNLQPKNLFLTWWGDQLVETDVEECNLIDAKTGKKTKLFTLDDINKWADSDPLCAPPDERYLPLP